jgi:hypothetical protein
MSEVPDYESAKTIDSVPDAVNPVPEPPPADPLRKIKITLSSVAFALGILTIIVTITHGGGPIARGVLLGAVLATMAGARLFLMLKHHI